MQHIRQGLQRFQGLLWKDGFDGKSEEQIYTRRTGKGRTGRDSHRLSGSVRSLIIKETTLACEPAALLQCWAATGPVSLLYGGTRSVWTKKKKPSHFKASLDHRDQVRRKKNMKRETKGQAQRILGTHSLSHLSNRYLEVFLVEVTPRLRALQQQTCSSDSPVIRRSHDWFPSSKSYKSVFLIWLLKCQDSQIWTLKLFYVEKYMASQISQLCWWP